MFENFTLGILNVGIFYMYYCNYKGIHTFRYLKIAYLNSLPDLSLRSYYKLYSPN